MLAQISPIASSFSFMASASEALSLATSVACSTVSPSPAPPSASMLLSPPVMRFAPLAPVRGTCGLSPSIVLRGSRQAPACAPNCETSESCRKPPSGDMPRTRGLKVPSPTPPCVPGAHLCAAENGNATRLPTKPCRRVQKNMLAYCMHVDCHVVRPGSRADLQGFLNPEARDPRLRWKKLRVGRPFFAGPFVRQEAHLGHV